MKASTWQATFISWEASSWLNKFRPANTGPAKNPNFGIFLPCHQANSLHKGGWWSHTNRQMWFLHKWFTTDAWRRTQHIHCGALLYPQQLGQRDECSSKVPACDHMRVMLTNTTWSRISNGFVDLRSAGCQHTREDLRDGALERCVHDAQRMTDSETTRSSWSRSPSPMVWFLLLWMPMALELVPSPLLASSPLWSNSLKSRLEHAAE